MMTEETTPIPDCTRLREAVSGRVFRSDEPGYREEIAGYNALSPTDPDVVVTALTESDVQAAVRFAEAEGLQVVIQATGHGAYRPVTDGLMIRTHRLDTIRVDDQGGTFTIGAGTRWMDILPVLAEHGLTAVTGSSPSVGAVGLVLGGGAGPLGRTLGWAAERVRSFRVVVGSGDTVVASEDSHPDLFWALRGGKVGLGVVTEATIETVRMTHVYGGGIFFAEEHIADVHGAWHRWVRDIPESVNSSIAILRLPPVGVPEPLAGKTLVHVRFAYVDPELTASELSDRGALAAAPLRAWAPAVLDGIGLLPADQVGTIHAEPFGPIPVWERGEFLADIDDAYVDTILKFAGAGVDAPFSAVETRRLGAALEGKSSAHLPIGGRTAQYALLVIGVPIPGINDEALATDGPALFDAVASYAHSEINYNWAGHPTDADFDRLWATEAATRLASIRHHYDPAGVFRFRD